MALSSEKEHRVSLAHGPKGSVHEYVIPVCLDRKSWSQKDGVKTLSHLTVGHRQKRIRE